VSEDRYPRPEHGWTCFHCGETFDSTFAGVRAARDHFGWTIDADPACQIKRDERQLVFRIRAQEEQLARYQNEDSDKDREHHALVARHAGELSAAEQRGYDRGLADMRKHGYRLVEERERPDLYNAAAE
jgi:hypothetical protein